MRYDKLVRSLQRLEANYEQKVRALLLKYAKRDEQTERIIRKHIRTVTPTKKLKWQQTPEGRAKIAKHMKAWHARNKVKHAAA